MQGRSRITSTSALILSAVMSLPAGSNWGSHLPGGDLGHACSARESRIQKSPRVSAGFKECYQAIVSAVLTDGQFLALEGELIVYRRAWRRAEVRQSDQVLQVIGEPAEREWEPPEISRVFERIAIFEIAARRVVSPRIDYERIIHPFADLVR